jgi:hypothetical protein
MKKTAYLCALSLTLFALTACEKSDVTTTETQETVLSKKGGGTTAAPVFGGQATGVNAIVVNTQQPIVTSNQTILAQTAALPATGGSQQASATAVSIPGALSADALTASANGVGDRTVSQSSATNLNITIAGNVITATSVQSSATAVCGSSPGGSTTIENLVVNGNPVTVTGAANQAIFLPTGGMIMINEQSVSKKGGKGSIVVTGLHLILPNGSDIRIASAKAEIKC